AISELEVNAFAMDDDFYYVAGWDSDRVAQVDRTTGAITELADFGTLSSLNNKLIAHDTNGDGKADVLYFQDGGDETVFYICGLSQASPWVAELASWGTGTASY